MKLKWWKWTFTLAALAAALAMMAAMGLAATASGQAQDRAKCGVADMAAVTADKAKMYADQAAASAVRTAIAPAEKAGADWAMVPAAKAEACLVKKDSAEVVPGKIYQMKIAAMEKQLGKAIHQAQNKVQRPFVKSLFVAQIRQQHDRHQNCAAANIIALQKGASGQNDRTTLACVESPLKVCSQSAVETRGYGQTPAEMNNCVGADKAPAACLTAISSA